ncbi:MAG: hypothetical protein ACRCVV_14630 [Shewanella sp.]|uniref:hypothetical protein n=1 Tax=Aeromonas popoffii TaxID=70856 RepID=UPI003F3B5B88
MKISNSKKELAKIISENGGWRKGSYAAQDSVIRFFTGDRPKYNKATKLWDADNSGLRIIAIGGAKLLQNRQRTILSRAEYFHLYPAPDADGWIECNGVAIPVRDDLEVDVKFRCGEVNLGKAAGAWQWVHGGWRHDIIAYRPYNPEQAKSTTAGDGETSLEEKEELEAIELSEPKEQCAFLTMSCNPSIEMLADYYRNKLAYADRKQDEADKANMESDAALSELEKAIAAIGFAITPIGADVKEPELVITCRSHLELGDLIWLSECSPKDDMPEGEYRVVKVGTIGVEFNGRTTYPDFSVRSWHFIRRPAK